MARRETNIFKRKDGRFEARFIKGREANGKAKYGAVYAPTYAEVKVKRDKAKAELLRSENLSVSKSTKQTITDAMESYLISIKNQIKESTFGLYQRYIENYISPHFQNTPCSWLTSEMTQGFVDSLLGSGLSVVTVQSVFSFLKNGVKASLPKDTFAIKLPKKQPNKVEVLTVDEQRRLELAAKDSDAINRISIILCLYTGIRVGELSGLLWTDIDFERHLLSVNRTVQRVRNTDGDAKTKVACLTPKSDTSERDIPLPNFLIEMLKEHKKASSASYIITLNGNSIEPRTIQRRFKKLLAIANIRDVNFHILRHSFATRALETGFDIKTLSEILGHSSATITLQKYAHVLDEHKRRNMELLGERFQ